MMKRTKRMKRMKRTKRMGRRNYRSSKRSSKKKLYKRKTMRGGMEADSGGTEAGGAPAKVLPPTKKITDGEIIFFYKKKHTDLTESQIQAINSSNYKGYIGRNAMERLAFGILIYNGGCIGVIFCQITPPEKAEIGKVEIEEQYQGRSLCTTFVSFMIEQLKLLGIKLINMRNSSTTISKIGGPPGLPAHICYCKAALQNGYKITISNDSNVKYKDINLDVNISDLPTFFSEDNRILSFILSDE
jgi:hypothetical protein